MDHITKHKTNSTLAITNLQKALKFLENLKSRFSLSRFSLDIRENPFATSENLKRSKRKMTLIKPFNVRPSEWSIRQNMCLHVKGRIPVSRVVTLLAEVVHVLRPIIYCFLLKYFGSKKWTPFVINLAVDGAWILLHWIGFKTGKQNRKNAVSVTLLFLKIWGQLNKHFQTI